MKTLIAKTTLTGDYGHVEPGDKFKADDQTADSLVERDLAELSSGQVEAIEGSHMTADDDQTATEKAGGKKVPDTAGTEADKTEPAASTKGKTDKTVTTDKVS